MSQHTKIVRTRLHKFSTHGANSGTGSVPGQRSRCCYDTCCPKTSETDSRGHFCFCVIVGKLSCHTRPRTSVSLSERLIFFSAVRRSARCFTLYVRCSAQSLPAETWRRSGKSKHVVEKCDWRWNKRALFEMKSCRPLGLAFMLYIFGECLFFYGVILLFERVCVLWFCYSRASWGGSTPWGWGEGRTVVTGPFGKASLLLSIKILTYFYVSVTSVTCPAMVVHWGAESSARSGWNG